MTDLPARVSRRNVFLLLVDYCTFGVGMTFLGVTTVLPSLVRLLGGGPVVVGSLGAIQSGGWLLPQLLAGRYVAGRPLVKRFIVIPAGVGRGLLALFPGVLMLFAGRAPAVALAVLLAVSTCFWVADALASVAWFDLVAKAIPAERRGRVMGAGGSIGGLLGIGAGWAVTGILARPDPFPSSYALLIVLASACFGVGLASMAAIHEPRGAGRGEAQAGWRDYIPRLGLILRTDARFVWLTLTRWLGGFADMAAAFYVLFATDRLGVPQQEIGLFLSAGVAGSLLSGVLLGPLRDRKGSACIVTATLALRCFCPAAALLAPLVAGGRPHAGLPNRQFRVARVFGPRAGGAGQGGGAH